MNGREKVLSCLNFDKGSRSVKAEFAFWYETLDRWYKEGLPKKEPHKKAKKSEEKDGDVEVDWDM